MSTQRQQDTEQEQPYKQRRQRAICSSQTILGEGRYVHAAPADDSGRTTLQAAPGEAHLAVVERLLEKQAYVNAAPAPGSGRTAIQAASEGGHIAVVERLLEKGPMQTQRQSITE